MIQKHHVLLILVLTLEYLDYTRCARVTILDLTDPVVETESQHSNDQVVLQSRFAPLIPIAGRLVAAATPHLIKQGTQFVNNHFNGKQTPSQGGSIATGAAETGGSDTVEEPNADTNHVVQGGQGQQHGQGPGRRNRKRQNQPQSQRQPYRKNQRPQYSGRQQNPYEQQRYDGDNQSGYGRRNKYNNQRQWNQRNPYSGFNPQYPYQNPGGGYGGPPINIFINYPNPNSPQPSPYQQYQQNGKRHQRTPRNQPQQRSRHGYQ